MRIVLAATKSVLPRQTANVSRSTGVQRTVMIRTGK
jgi:hypothetical protein